MLRICCYLVFLALATCKSVEFVGDSRVGRVDAPKQALVQRDCVGELTKLRALVMLDTSASMDRELDLIKSNISQFVTSLQTLQLGSRPYPKLK